MLSDALRAEIEREAFEIDAHCYHEGLSELVERIERLCHRTAIRAAEEAAERVERECIGLVCGWCGADDEKHGEWRVGRADDPIWLHTFMGLPNPFDCPASALHEARHQRQRARKEEESR